MRKINSARLLLGGLLAGVVVYLLAWAAWILFLGRMEAAVGATHPPTQESAAADAPSILGSFIAGFVGVGLYVAIRPRFGPGPKTALLAGLLCWFVACVVSMVLDMFWRGPQLPLSLIAIAFVTMLVLVVTGTVVGAWVYKEQG